MSPKDDMKFYAIVEYDDPYVQPLILQALAKRVRKSSYKLISSLSELKELGSVPLFQFSAYESLDFDLALRREDCLINAYVIRKALIRKHFLSTTISNWIVKHPNSPLKRHFKPAVDFELDYAEFLDDALLEAFELRESFERNDGKESKDREWWILKPSMSDRGQGIRLFSSEDELAAIFEEWEAAQPDSDEEDTDDGNETYDHAGRISSHENVTTEASRSASEEKKASSSMEDHIIISQLRHFIAQPYVHPPLLLPGTGNRKFHIRTYVLSVGSLCVYVYKPMLALFAAFAYEPPWSSDSPDLRAHLTNTCLQGTSEREGSVRVFWDLPDDAVASPRSTTRPGESGSWKDSVFAGICETTGELFAAAARGMMVHFQPLPNAFELFGVDFLVDENGTPWLLEVNAFPDFRQTGDDLRDIVQGLFVSVIDTVVKPFFGVGQSISEDSLVKVLDIDLGKR